MKRAKKPKDSNADANSGGVHSVDVSVKKGRKRPRDVVDTEEIEWGVVAEGGVSGANEPLLRALGVDLGQLLLAVFQASLPGVHCVTSTFGGLTGFARVQFDSAQCLRAAQALGEVRFHKVPVKVVVKRKFCQGDPCAAGVRYGPGVVEAFLAEAKLGITKVLRVKDTGVLVLFESKALAEQADLRLPTSLRGVMLAKLPSALGAFSAFSVKKAVKNVNKSPKRVRQNVLLAHR
eukprot:RCo028874